MANSEYWGRRMREAESALLAAERKLEEARTEYERQAAHYRAAVLAEQPKTDPPF